MLKRINWMFWVACMAVLVTFVWSEVRAQAEAPIYVAKSAQGDVMELYAAAEPKCPGPDGKKTIYHVNVGPQAGSKVAGCYVIIDETVYAIFEDGDRFRLPLSIFKQPGV